MRLYGKTTWRAENYMFVRSPQNEASLELTRCGALTTDVRLAVAELPTVPERLASVAELKMLPQLM